MKTTDNLLKLLQDEKHHSTICNKLALKDVLSTVEKNMWKHSMKSLTDISNSLKAYYNDEISLCRVLNKKQSFDVKKLIFNTQAIEYRRKLNDFQLDDEKLKKIGEFELFIISLLISFNKRQALSQSDLFYLSNGVLTESQYKQLLADILLTNISTNEAVNKVNLITITNKNRND